MGTFSWAQIDLRKARERELATLDEKSTSSGIVEPGRGPDPLCVCLFFLSSFFRGGQRPNKQTLAPNYGHFFHICHRFGNLAPFFAYFCFFNVSRTSAVSFFCPPRMRTIAKYAAGCAKFQPLVNRFWCVYVLLGAACDSQRRLGILPPL